MAAFSLPERLHVWLTSDCVRQSALQAGVRGSRCVSDNALETFLNAFSTDVRVVTCAFGAAKYIVWRAAIPRYRCSG